MNPIGPARPLENHILACLPAQDADQLRLNLEPISFPLGEVVYEVNDPIDYVYFIESGMVSLVSLTEEGETFEVGIVGYRGIVGATVFLDEETAVHRTVIQAEATALRMKTSTFKVEFEHAVSLQTLLRRYCSALFRQITQSAICSRFHSAEARLCRWLLQTRDCVRSNNLYLTHEFLAQMLGTHRPAVTLSAGLLQNAGLIRYNRGHITILDPEGMESSACECCKAITEANDLVFRK
jgi:CRP-like cAMP-binding protein